LVLPLQDISQLEYTARKAGCLSGCRMGVLPTVIPVNTGQIQGPIAQQIDLIDSFGLASLQ
jgi:hypothetical protein